MKTIAWKDCLFYAGVAVGFLLAVALGREAAGFAKPAKFERFFQGISPDNLYYPTYASMEKLALDRWSPGQILVIIGGNSVLNGVGQPVADLWSHRLQELLGPRYAVINLAFRGAYPTEGAALVAEALQRRGIPLIYVTNTAPGACGMPVGSFYEYLYWDAEAAGKLTAYAPRDTLIATWPPLQQPAAHEKSQELQRAAALNHWLHFQDLWTHIGYRHAFTVWNSITRRAPWAPRSKSIDLESAPEPVAQRFLTNNDTEMTLVRGSTEALMVRDEAGHWQKNLSYWKSMDQVIEGSFVPALRPVTLMIVSLDCPYYRDQLTPDELARDDAVYRLTEPAWRQHGIHCVTAGIGFLAEDYRDRRHLAPSGGAKLAAQVAAEILNMKPSPL